MASIKISDLTSVTTLTDNDVLPIVNGNDTKKVSISQLKEQFSGTGAYVIVENGSSSSYNINTTANKNTINQMYADYAAGKPTLAFLLSTHHPGNTASTPSYLYPLQVMWGESKMYAIAHPNFSSSNVAYGGYYNLLYTIQISYSGTISDSGLSVTSVSMMMQSNWLPASDSISQSKVPLCVSNTSAFTPSGNYNPSTKLYSDTVPLTKAGLSAYNSGSTYNSGDYVYKSATDLGIYKCKSDSTTGTWDSSKWDSKTYLEYLSDSVGGGGDMSNYYTKSEIDGMVYEGVHIYSPEDTTHPVIHVFHVREGINRNTGENTLQTLFKKAYNMCRTHLVTGVINEIRIIGNNSTGGEIQFVINWNGNNPTGWQGFYFVCRDESYIGRRYAQWIATFDSNGDITGFSNFNVGTTYDAMYALGTSNTIAYTPTSNYHPSTKKYVDDSISNKIWIGTQTEYDNLSSYSDSTLYFIKDDTNVSA